MARTRTREVEETPAAETPAAVQGARMSVQLTDDGGIAWDRMRPATRDQLRKALSDPAAVAQLGLTTGSTAAAADDVIDGASLATIIYGASSTIMVAIARRAGYTNEQAGVLAFTPQETEQLGPLTGKVLNKWLPTGKYQDELILGLMLTTVISGKLALLRRTAAVVSIVPQRDATAPENTQ